MPKYGLLHCVNQYGGFLVVEIDEIAASLTVLQSKSLENRGKMPRSASSGSWMLLTARDRELDMLFERLYEDNVAGKIDDAWFAKMSKRYEQEQGENAKKIKALRLEQKKDENKCVDIEDFL